jgi:hypothetical protein
VSHEACGGHLVYGLTCLEYDRLVGARDGECAICGLPAELEIDHDHAIGITAVRGLTCHQCNRRLVGVDMGEREPTKAEAFYLRYAWHKDHRSPSDHRPDGRTKNRPVRVPDAQWERWMAAVEADEKETTVSDEIRAAMDKYADRVLRRKR